MRAATTPSVFLLGILTIAGLTLDCGRNIAVPGAGQKVSLPMAGDGTILHGRGPLPNRHRILNLAQTAALYAGMSGPSDRASGALVIKQRPFQNASVYRALLSF